MLDSSTAGEGADIIENPPKIDCYQNLKAELLKRLSASKEDRIRRILGDEDIGDTKPFQYSRHLHCLSGSNFNNDDIIRQLWMRRLPKNVQIILAALLDLPLEKAADIADKILEIATPRTVSTIQGPSIELAELRL